MATVKKVVKKTTKKAQYGTSTSMDSKGRYNVVTKSNTPEGPRYYQYAHPSESTANMFNNARARANSADSIPAAKVNPIDIKKLAGYKNGGKTVKKAVKKAQSGIMSTKLKDVPGKVKKAATNVKDAVNAGFNKTVDKVKNTTVGDALKFVANPSYSAAESAVKSLNRSKLAKKAQNGDLISKYGLKPKNLNDRQLNRVSKISETNVERSKKVANRISERRNARGAESAKNPLYFKNGGKQMIKRADGSTSQRGLWDNIRAAKGSGKKPTAAMLKQEKKIKLTSKKK